MSPFQGRHVHLMGIGGAGVSALAPLLQRAGARVSGCDSVESAVTRMLRRSGLAIAIGHAPEHSDGVDVMVHTSAVGEQHPELKAARERGVSVLTRSACLVKLMQGKFTVAVAGSHGKTSTTWMLGHLLTSSGRDPVVMVGGSVTSLGDSGARVGDGAMFVAETDESDGSFALISPDIAILTNLDHEHVRHYGDFSRLEREFRLWFARVPKDGAVIIPTAGLSDELTKDLQCRVIRCGLDAGDYRCTDLRLNPDGSTCRVWAYGKDLGEMTVTIPGAHMVANALMAVAAARLVDPQCDIGSMARCERVRRRFTVHGAPSGIRVVEDYGHHPTEIRATIAAARLGGGRVHILFQPHRYTRTADCFDDFVNAFDQAYAVSFLPIYAASEEPLPGVSSLSLAKAIANRRAGLGENAGLVRAHDDFGEAKRFIAGQAQPGDTCLVLGAGDVGECAPELLTMLGGGA